MRKRLVLAMLVLLAVGVGVGGTIIVQRLSDLPNPDPHGVAVVCLKAIGAQVAGQRCWQGGEEVGEPPSACDLGDTEETGQQPLWSQLQGGTATTYAYVCRHFE